jgi:hypothetical protein
MNLLERIKGILFRPADEWSAIEHESGNPAYLFRNYVAKLAAIPAIAGFIGGSVVGVSVAGAGWVRLPVLSGLFNAAVSYILTFVVVYAVAVIIDLLASSFGGKRDFQNALKLSAYSFTPAWLAGVFLIVPGLRFLTVLGLYGLYLLWVGLPQLMKSPRGKTLYYAAAVAVCVILIEAAIGYVFTGFAMAPQA